jgi:hypothetical protein
MGLWVAPPVLAQEAAEESAEPAASDDAVEQVKQKTEEALAAAEEKVEEIAAEVDQSQEAKEAKAGLLKQIYALAELLSFRAFYWLAFALMIAGVVGFALQLVLAKLVVLAKRSLSVSETLSDSFGLAISLVGLVLTTQAATENSEFTESAFAVLSAAGVGALVGIILYWWGQAQEVQAAEGRKVT